MIRRRRPYSIKKPHILGCVSFYSINLCTLCTIAWGVDLLHVRKLYSLHAECRWFYPGIRPYLTLARMGILGLESPYDQNCPCYFKSPQKLNTTFSNYINGLHRNPFEVILKNLYNYIGINHVSTGITSVLM